MGQNAIHGEGAQGYCTCIASRGEELLPVPGQFTFYNLAHLVGVVSLHRQDGLLPSLH